MDKPAILGGRPQFPKMIPFLKPQMDRYINLLTKDLISILKSNIVTNGSVVEKLENEVGNYLGLDVAALSSCTSGLMITTQLLGLKNQEVIIPSFTFCATAIAMSWNNCKLKFVDIDEETFTLSADKVNEAISPKTKAILGVNIFGHPCDVKGLSDLASDHKINLFFDSAQGLGSIYHNKKIGNFGDAEIFSCSPTKLMSTIEGGIVSSHDKDLIKKIKIARNYGVLENYNIEYQGLSARLEEFNAAVGLRFMKDLDFYVKKRNDYAKRYIRDLEGIKGMSFQKIKSHVRSTYKDFAIVIDPKIFGMKRDVFVEALARENIPIKKYYYPPVHKTDMYKEYSSAELPATEKISSNIVCLPIYNIMDDEMIDSISNAVIKIHSNATRISNAVKIIS